MPKLATERLKERNAPFLITLSVAIAKNNG
jgi:hypothetical protein